MRISPQAQKETRERILQAAATLFAQRGFEQTTTRELAKAAGLAAGTLFNYFPSKESLAMAMVNAALQLGREDYRRHRHGDEELAEELFLFISSGLRRLKPLRPFIGPALERSLSPFAGKIPNQAGETTRQEHLEIVRQIIVGHGYSRVPALVADTLYWSLYLGILAFWSHDVSEHQQETLALLDHALALYAGTLATTGNMDGVSK
ncbi:MAG: TetR/AcrR family transcriptional regulator [Desulfobulbaceae bacterium]|nr:TetR/AcrR family transcriptional regulator [Desulfobulbaceae bacterium]